MIPGVSLPHSGYHDIGPFKDMCTIPMHGHSGYYDLMWLHDSGPIKGTPWLLITQLITLCFVYKDLITPYHWNESDMDQYYSRMHTLIPHFFHTPNSTSEL